jgi:hypothetical protein
MTISPRLFRALTNAGISFAVGAIAHISLGVEHWLVRGGLIGAVVGVSTWRDTDSDGVPTVNHQQLALRFVAAGLVGVAVVFWSKSAVFGLLIAAVVFAVMAVLRQ